MRRAGILIAALMLASCAFGSERPLFGAEDALVPIPNGTVYVWRPYPDTGDSLRVRFRRVGLSYEALPLNRPDERPMRILFTDIIQTHDDDYIAQIDINGEGEGRAYAFLWPWGDDRYRVIADPRAFDEDGENAAPDLCAPASYGGCVFESADDARAYFMRVLYPALRSGQTPRQFIDIAPEGAEMPPLPEEPPLEKPATK